MLTATGLELWSPDTASFVTARRLRRRLPLLETPAFVRSSLDLATEVTSTPALATLARVATFGWAVVASAAVSAVFLYFQLLELL